jgi:hypothetical protein
MQALNPSALRLIRAFENETTDYLSHDLGLKGVARLADWLAVTPSNGGRPA